MSIRSRLAKWLDPILAGNPHLKETLKLIDTRVDTLRTSVGQLLPQVIRPELRSLFISLTANCNLRCKGCRYGRDFMSGHQLTWPLVRTLLADAKALGFEKVRLYGGEPLLHKDLAKIIEYATNLGLRVWVTTNGVLLEKKMDELFDAGLKKITIGFYGIGKDYDNYVQQQGSFEQVETGIAYVRKKYGQEVKLGLDWLLMRPTCNLKAMEDLWNFARRYETPIGVNLIHYSLPYFVMGQNPELQFRSQDRESINSIVESLIRFKKIRPDLILDPTIALRAVPDWLIKGPDMRVPCHAYRLVWIGADGAVQMCYVGFGLGNLHEKSLSEMLFSLEHYRSARNAFSLNCPNCHCGFGNRTLAYGPTRRRYSRQLI